jgi:hypothetical protein
LVIGALRVASASIRTVGWEFEMGVIIPMYNPSSSIIRHIETQNITLLPQHTYMLLTHPERYYSSVYTQATRPSITGDAFLESNLHPISLPVHDIVRMNEDKGLTTLHSPCPRPVVLPTLQSDARPFQYQRQDHAAKSTRNDCSNSPLI